MQSFLFRAILCDKNTLFVVEIVDTFTDYQLNKLFNFIDKLLSIKYLKNKNESKNLDKLKTKEYLDSCVVFIYDDDLNNNLKELEKYMSKNLDKNYCVNKVNMPNNEQNENNNNKIFTPKKSFHPTNDNNELDKERNNNTIDSPLNISFSSIFMNNYFNQELENIRENIKVIS